MTEQKSVDNKLESVNNKQTRILARTLGTELSEKEMEQIAGGLKKTIDTPGAG